MAFPGVAGTVAAATVWDADGGGPGAALLVAGGSFEVAGTVLASNIAAWDGSSWAALGAGTNAGVKALAALPSGDLVAGGWFNAAGGVPARRIARWDGSNWAPLGEGMGTYGAVEALAVLPNGDLVAGGWFTMAGGVSANCIARWDGTNWTPLGSGIGGGWLPIVNALCVLPGGDLVVGGTFETAGGGAASSIARWDGANWTALGAGVSGGGVKAIAALANGDLAVGGGFTSAAGVAGTRFGVGGGMPVGSSLPPSARRRPASTRNMTSAFTRTSLTGHGGTPSEPPLPWRDGREPAEPACRGRAEEVRHG